MPAQRFDKKLQQKIVEPHAGHGHQKIAHQLYAPPQVRSLENHIHAEVKANGKGDEKGHDKRRYVRFKSNKAKIENLLVQNEIVKEVIENDVEERIAATASRIMVSLQGHETPEKRVKYIQYRKNVFSYLVMDLTHKGRIYSAFP